MYRPFTLRGIAPTSITTAAAFVVAVVVEFCRASFVPHNQREVDFEGAAGTQVVRLHHIAALQVGKVQICLSILVLEQDHQLLMFPVALFGVLQLSLPHLAGLPEVLGDVALLGSESIEILGLKL